MEKMEFDETDIKYEDIKIVEVGGMKVNFFFIGTCHNIFYISLIISYKNYRKIAFALHQKYLPMI